MFERLPEWVGIAGEWLGATIIGLCGVLIVALVISGIIVAIKTLKDIEPL